LPSAAPLGCGALTGAGTVLNVVGARPGQTIAIFGMGAVGLSALMVAVAAGATVIAVDLNEPRLSLARELGAAHALRADVELRDRLAQLAPGGVDTALECSGSPAAAHDALTILGVRGTLALVGAPPADAKLEADFNRLLVGGRVVRGVIEGDADPAVLIPRLLAMKRAGKFPIERLITAYPFDAINEAVAECGRGTVIKPVLIMDSAT
jgi:aryl-alcohol dehydrogenase